MPLRLKRGRSQKAISANIRTFYHDFVRKYGKRKALRMAKGAAYSTARKRKRK